MTKELLKEFEKEEDDKKEKDEDEKEDKDVEKSVNTVLEQLQSIVDSQSALISTQKAIGNAVIELSERVKAMETPTDLPLKPKESDKQDIGAKVTVPDTYQSNSQQASLNDDGKGTSKDKPDLKMQQKSATTPSFNFTTETPRPNAALEEVNKGYSSDYSQILKDARASGDLSQVARDILGGKYYTPGPEEIGY